jgi:hypothetical protein
VGGSTALERILRLPPLEFGAPAPGRGGGTVGPAQGTVTAGLPAGGSAALERIPRLLPLEHRGLAREARSGQEPLGQAQALWAEARLG